MRDSFTKISGDKEGSLQQSFWWKLSSIDNHIKNLDDFINNKEPYKSYYWKKLDIISDDIKDIKRNISNKF